VPYGVNLVPKSYVLPMKRKNNVEQTTSRVNYHQKCKSESPSPIHLPFHFRFEEDHHQVALATYV
jgi:hypothetical protein